MADDSFENKHTKIPSWILPAIVGLIFILTIGLALYYYLVGNENVSSSEETSSTAPILNSDGSNAYVHSYVLNVGNGICFFAIAPEGKTLLVDTGHNKDFDVLSDVLTQHNVKKIDVLLLSCSDKGHIGGVEKLINQYPVSVCYMTQHSMDDSKMQPVITLLKKANTSIQIAEATFTSTIPWADNTELRILSPYNVAYENEKDYSLMVRLAYGSSEILLAGDANKVAERMVVKALPDTFVHSDVLVVSDHGDKDGTNEKFLSSVHPSIAVISCSDNNPPASETLKSLNAVCDNILQTNQNGTVHIILDGATSQVIE